MHIKQNKHLLRYETIVYVHIMILVYFKFIVGVLNYFQTICEHVRACDLLFFAYFKRFFKSHIQNRIEQFVRI